MKKAGSLSNREALLSDIGAPCHEFNDETVTRMCEESKTSANDLVPLFSQSMKLTEPT